MIYGLALSEQIGVIRAASSLHVIGHLQMVEPHLDLLHNKAAAMGRHTERFGDWILTDKLLVYTDGSKAPGGCDTSWVGFERGSKIGRLGMSPRPSGLWWNASWQMFWGL